MEEEGESLLVFSDVHLGSDLNDSGPVVPRSAAIDADLAAMLVHYRGNTPPGGRWRLVIAGDFIDLVGMAIDPADDDSAATPTERAYGLGGAEAHVRAKMRRVAARHAAVFAELARFVGDGHGLTVVHGNHDLELHWDSVKADFCALIGVGLERVDFEPWFFYRPGVAFIEHGHQYDPFCATPWILSPLSPLDPLRVAPSLSDTLLRYIVRRTPGMKEYGHEDRGLASYVSWGLMLGLRGTIALYLRFQAAMVQLWLTARAYGSAAGETMRNAHADRVARLAEATAVPRARLDAALALHVRSLGQSPRTVLASVMLDRVLVILASLVVLALVVSSWHRLEGWAIPTSAILLASAAGAYVLVSRARPSVDPASFMLGRAADLVKLFPASFVVMGHTHLPLVKRLSADAVYANVGAWAEEEPESGTAAAYRAPRTHLVIHARAAAHEAQLLEWRSGEGPRELERQSVKR